LVGALGAGAWWYWSRPPLAPAIPVDPGRAEVRIALPVPKQRFTDITEKAGIRFHHTNGSFGKKLLPETMGSGVAFLDYAGAAKQDLLFINSCYWPGYADPNAKTQPTLA